MPLANSWKSAFSEWGWGETDDSIFRKFRKTIEVWDPTKNKRGCQGDVRGRALMENLDGWFFQAPAFQSPPSHGAISNKNFFGMPAVVVLVVIVPEQCGIKQVMSIPFVAVCWISLLGLMLSWRRSHRKAGRTIWWVPLQGGWGPAWTKVVEQQMIESKLLYIFWRCFFWKWSGC